MSHRHQLLIPEELDLRLRKAAQRTRQSKGAWVRRAIEESLRRQAGSKKDADPLTRLASLEAPTADIDEMIAQIEAGRQ